MDCEKLKSLVLSLVSLIKNDTLSCYLTGSDKNACACGNGDNNKNPAYYNTVLSKILPLMYPTAKKFEKSLEIFAKDLDACHPQICGQSSNNTSLPCSDLNDLVSQILIDVGYSEYTSIVIKLLCVIAKYDISFLSSIIPKDVIDIFNELKPMISECLCVNDTSTFASLAKEACSLIADPCVPPIKIDKPYANKNIVLLLYFMSIFFCAGGVACLLFKNIWLKWGLFTTGMLFFILCMVLLLSNPYSVIFLDPETTNKWISLSGNYRGEATVLGMNISMTFNITKDNTCILSNFSCDGGSYCDYVSKLFTDCVNNKFTILTSAPENFGYRIVGSCIDNINKEHGDAIKGVFVIQTGDLSNIEVYAVYIFEVHLAGTLQFKLKVPLKKI